MSRLSTILQSFSSDLPSLRISAFLGWSAKRRERERERGAARLICINGRSRTRGQDSNGSTRLFLYLIFFFFLQVFLSVYTKKRPNDLPVERVPPRCWFIKNQFAAGSLELVIPPGHAGPLCVFTRVSVRENISTRIALEELSFECTFVFMR